MSLVCPSCDVAPPAHAVAGRACVACGAPLVISAPLGTAGFVPVDEAPPAVVASSSGGPPDAGELRIAVTLPGEDLGPASPLSASGAGEPHLEVDAAWTAERQARKDGAPPASTAAARRFIAEHGTRTPARGPGLVLLLVVIAAALGSVAYFVVLRPRASTSATDSRAPPPARGISIRIVGKPGTPITIDGKSVGKTPLTLQRTASTRALVISAPGGVVRQIIPDRDQTVDVGAP